MFLVTPMHAQTKWSTIYNHKSKLLFEYDTVYWQLHYKLLGFYKPLILTKSSKIQLKSHLNSFSH